MSRDLVWGSLSLKLKLQTFSTPLSVFWDILIRVVWCTGRKWLSLVSMLKAKFGKKNSIYFVSGTTIQHYIVPSLKKQFFFYKNPVLDLFCRVGWTKQYFPGSSSLTIIANVHDFYTIFSSIVEQLLKLFMLCQSPLHRPCNFVNWTWEW